MTGTAGQCRSRVWGHVFAGERPPTPVPDRQRCGGARSFVALQLLKQQNGEGIAAKPGVEREREGWEEGSPEGLEGKSRSEKDN